MHRTTNQEGLSSYSNLVKPMLLDVALRAAGVEMLTLVLSDSLISGLMDKRAFSEHDCSVPHA